MPESVTRHLELEALAEAVRWPNPAPTTVMMLIGQFMAAGRQADGYTYFTELARDRAEDGLPLAVAAFFQAQLGQDVPDALAKLDVAAQEPGLATYFRGLVLAALPAELGRTADAVADLELVLMLGAAFPPGMRRAVHAALAGLYRQLGRDEDADAAEKRTGMPGGQQMPPLVTDFWITERDGFRFTPPRLAEYPPDVYVAEGYDFSDIAFVVTAESVVAIDAGSTPENARAALAALREVTDLPISHVLLTHAHWDHVGGLEALRGPGTQIVAQAKFAVEQALQNEIPLPYQRFLPAGAVHRRDVTPDVLVGEPCTITVGGVDFALYPASGGETEDALIIHLPDRGVVFAGDILMPYLGAPFFAEGSVDGLIEAMRLIQRLGPQVVVHGHAPLTRVYTIEAFPGLVAALEDLYQVIRADLHDGATLTGLLHSNHLPKVLREHPAAVLPYIIIRESVIKRVHRQRTGYWQPDGEGIEHISTTEWAATLDLLAGGKPERFSEAVTELLDRSDLAPALRLAEAALVRYPDHAELAELHQSALYRMLERHQSLSPFKFLIYAETAGVELLPVE